MKTGKKIRPGERRELGRDELRTLFGIVELQDAHFADWCETIAAECRFPAGLLRPDDPVDILFEEGRSSPLVRSFTGFRVMEAQTELNYRLQTTRLNRGLPEVAERIQTIREMVDAWCELGPEDVT